ILDIDVLQFLLKNLSRKRDGSFEWKANFSLLKKNYKKIISAIELESPLYTPTLFIRGGRSKYILKGDWENIKEYFYNADIITFPDTGHWVHAEKPAELLTEVQKFFSNNLVNNPDR
ncbi:MAG: hypothetical protein R3250_10830, partial [Melioribacteraceae bacterium]|nr:hypothetical protein [Melioribacteraceae bacterium]